MNSEGAKDAKKTQIKQKEGLLMNTTRRRAAVLLIFVAMLLSTSCSQLRTDRSGCDGQYPVRSGAGGNYQYGSKSEKFSYLVEGEMSITRLHLVFEHNAGSVSWSFSDPLGEVRWEDEYGQAGVFDETREFEPIEGEWRLEIDSQNGSGRYDHCWMAR